MPYHEPVMAQEVMDLLDPKDGGLYLDGTLGGGGHARLILESCPRCRLLGVDRDPDAIAASRRALADHLDRVTLLQAGFDDAIELAVPEEPLAGALLDLGVSSHQLDSDARGFTFRTGASLDMRMSGEGSAPSAHDLLNDASAEDLERIFRSYGEEPRARKLAREVVARRRSLGMETSDDLVAALRKTLGRPATTTEKARIFQAVRIAVNGEIDALEEALPTIRDALASGGVLVVISYHSLEDRVVKRAFRDWSRDCVCPPGLPVCACRGRALGRVLTPRPTHASDLEVQRNPRARSARLRAWERA